MLRGAFEVVQVKIEIEIYRGVRTVIKNRHNYRLD